MHRIEGLRLHGVGPFKDLELKFPKKPEGSTKATLHLFTGQNGTGKTTLLYAIANMIDWQSGRGRLLTPRFAAADSYAQVLINNFDYYLTPQQATNEIPEFLPIERSVRHTMFVNHPWGCIYGREQEHSDFQNISNEAQSRAGYNPQNTLPGVNFSWALFGYSGARILGYSPLSGIQEITTSPFQGALFAVKKEPNQLVQWIANLESKSALYRQKGDSEKADRILRTLRTIEKAVSDITEKSVRFSMDIDPLIVFFEVDDVQLTFELLPEGLKSILSWMADLLMRLDRIPWEGDASILERSFFLFLDEVDVHLHPAWQRKILAVTQKLFPNATIFATTHSPFVVGSVDEGTIYRFDLDKKGLAYLSGTHQALPGRSVELILEEVFGISDQFDDATEMELSRLRELRETVLQSKGGEGYDEWESLLDRLDMMGVEVAAIAARERRQMVRLLERT
ncbi:MAG: AAA family ATPase [Proteobacteria bacterium]|nr:AAA family ATPase [Pseudomonadota bacterium]